jgi:hypothetical protein
MSENPPGGGPVAEAPPCDLVIVVMTPAGIISGHETQRPGPVQPNIRLNDFDRRTRGNLLNRNNIYVVRAKLEVS